MKLLGLLAWICIWVKAIGNVYYYNCDRGIRTEYIQKAVLLAGILIFSGLKGC